MTKRKTVMFSPWLYAENLEILKNFKLRIIHMAICWWENQNLALLCQIKVSNDLYLAQLCER